MEPLTDDATRIHTLIELDLLDTPQEKEFDDLVRLASAICGTAISLVSLLDKRRQWFKAAVGLDIRETPIEFSFCAQTIRQNEVFVVEDASQDPRFQANPLVTGAPHIRFYAGIPLHAPNGCAVGALCVIDTARRQLTEAQLDGMRILAAQVEARMELRQQQKTIARSQAENGKLFAELKATNDLFEQFMHNGPFASYIKDGEGRIVFYNRFLARLFGVDEKALLGKTDHDLWPREIADAFQVNDLAVLEGGVAVEFDETGANGNGGKIYWKSFKFPYHGADGNRMLAGISVDVTRQRMREAELQDALREKSQLAEQVQASQHILQTFMERTPNVTFVKDDQGRYVFYNRSFANHVGITRSEWIGRSDHEVFPKETAERYTAQDRMVMESGETMEFVDETVDAQGEFHRCRSLKFTYQGLDGRKLLAGVTVDVTDQLRREEALAAANLQLEMLATTDSLTGLANRRVFETRAAIEFSVARRGRRPLSVLMMDIDNFKWRNDTYGHAAGDAALAALGQILRDCVRMGDVAARLGGEEFGFLLPDTGPAGAMELAHRVQVLLAELPGAPAALTISVGIASLSETTEDWERLLSRADEAMYEAKRAGKNRVFHFDYLARNQAATPRALVPDGCNSAV